MGCITSLSPIEVAPDLASDPPLFVAADDVRLTVIDPFNPESAIAATDAIAAILRRKPRARPKALALLASIAAASDRGEFVAALDATYASFVARRFPQAEFVLLCLHLYVRGVILFPRNFVRGGETLFSPVYSNQSTPVNAVTAAELAALQDRVRRHARSKASNNLDLISRWAVRAVVTVGPYTPELTINEDTARIFAEFAPNDDRKYWAFREAIYALNRSAGSDGFTGDINEFLRPRMEAEHALVLDDKGTRRRRSTRRNDPTFAWSVLKDREVEPWRKLLEDWIGSLRARKSLSAEIVTGNHLLDFLIMHPGVTRDPVVFVKADYALAGGFLTYIADKKNDTISKAHAFFEFALDTLCTVEEEGSRYRLRGSSTPFPRMQSRHPGHTMAARRTGSRCPWPGWPSSRRSSRATNSAGRRRRSPARTGCAWPIQRRRRLRTSGTRCAPSSCCSSSTCHSGRTKYGCWTAERATARC